MTHWDRTLAAHKAQFWAELQRSVDHQRAIDWIKTGEAWLEACPDEVRDAMPKHADNVALIEGAISDIEGDVNGFYRKESER